MEFHSYDARSQLWNSTAMVRVHSYGIPQPWCAFTAMEFHSHGARSQLWNSAAMVRIHSYGIPELVQTDNGIEFTQRFPLCRRIHSSPRTFALYAHFLYNRAIRSPARAWTRQSFSSRFTIFSFGTKNAVGTGRWKSGRRMKNSIV
jgi:hypothetical protein